jgi:hypothetical protein
VLSLSPPRPSPENSACRYLYPRSIYIYTRTYANTTTTTTPVAGIDHSTNHRWIMIGRQAGRQEGRRAACTKSVAPIPDFTLKK